MYTLVTLKFTSLAQHTVPNSHAVNPITCSSKFLRHLKLRITKFELIILNLQSCPCPEFLSWECLQHSYSSKAWKSGHYPGCLPLLPTFITNPSPRHRAVTSLVLCSHDLPSIFPEELYFRLLPFLPLCSSLLTSFLHLLSFSFGSLINVFCCLSNRIYIYSIVRTLLNSVWASGHHGSLLRELMLKVMLLGSSYCLSSLLLTQ